MDFRNTVTNYLKVLYKLPHFLSTMLGLGVLCAVDDEYV